MATAETAYSMTFTLNLVRGGETAKRTLNFDYSGEPTAESIGSTAQNWLTNYNKLIQPSNWRDSDAAEEEWTTIGITPSAKVTTTTTYDAVSAAE